MEFYQFRNLCKDVRRMWPGFRGIKAGRRVRERANRCRYPTEVQLTNRINHSRSSWRYRNIANCITISPSQQNQQGARKVYVPSVLLSNVMSLACITETWLRDHIHDNVVCIPGYNLVRRDRIDVIHGGVRTYIKKGLQYTVLEDLYDDKIEAIWLQLRPSRLPRGLSCIIIANVYHPQIYLSFQSLRNYRRLIRTKHPDLMESLLGY